MTRTPMVFTPNEPAKKPALVFAAMKTSRKTNCLYSGGVAPSSLNHRLQALMPPA